MHASFASDIWVGGAGGQMAHKQGLLSSSPKTTPARKTTGALRGIWGQSPDDLWIVGDSGVVLHYSNNELLRVELPQAYKAKNLSAVWGRDNTLWIGGPDGLVLRLDTTSTTFLAQPIVGSAPNGVGAVHAIDGDADSVWLVGSNNLVATYNKDDKDWIRNEALLAAFAPGTPKTLRGLSVDRESIWIVGDGNVVFTSGDGGLTWPADQGPNATDVGTETVGNICYRTIERFDEDLWLGGGKIGTSAKDPCEKLVDPTVTATSLLCRRSGLNSAWTCVHEDQLALPRPILSLKIADGTGWIAMDGGKVASFAMPEGTSAATFTASDTATGYPLLSIISFDKTKVWAVGGGGTVISHGDL